MCRASPGGRRAICRVLLLGFATLVTGCGHNDLGQSPPPTIVGYFYGTIAETNNGQTNSATALAIGSPEAGRFQVATVDGYRQFDATISSATGSDFSGTARGFLGRSNSGSNSFVADVPMQGTYMAGHSLTGSFTLPTGATDTINLTYQKGIYETPTPVSALAGTWQEQQSRGYTLNATIDNNGHATGNDGHCTYTADFATADVNADLFTADESQQCSSTTTLSGFAVHVPQGSGTGVREQIIVITVGDSEAAARTFVRSGS